MKDINKENINAFNAKKIRSKNYHSNNQSADKQTKIKTMTVVSYDKHNHIIIAKDENGHLHQVTDYQYNENSKEYQIKNENCKP